MDTNCLSYFSGFLKWSSAIVQKNNVFFIINKQELSCEWAQEGASDSEIVPGWSLDNHYQNQKGKRQYSKTFSPEDAFM